MVLFIWYDSWGENIAKSKATLGFSTPAFQLFFCSFIFIDFSTMACWMDVGDPRFLDGMRSGFRSNAAIQHRRLRVGSGFRHIIGHLTLEFCSHAAVQH